MSRVCKIYECLLILPLIVELLIKLGIYQGVDYSNMPLCITAYSILLCSSYMTGWSFLNASQAIFLLDIIYIYLSVYDTKTREIILTALVKESGDLDKYKNIYFNEKSYIKKNIWRDLMLPKRWW